MKKLAAAFFIAVLLVLAGGYFFYTNGIDAVDKNNKKDIILEVKQGMGASQILDEMEKSGLLKSNLAGKIYLKLNPPGNLQANTYSFTKSMSLEEMITAISKGDSKYIKANRFTIIEGSDYRLAAQAISKGTGIGYDEIISKWTDRTFLEKLQEKYWFLGDDIFNSGVMCPLEGYIYPNTYAVSDSDNNIEKITYTILDETKRHFDALKDEFKKSKLSMSDVVKLASIVQLEGLNNEDKPIIAGIFMNRLEEGMKLQSCTTVLYYKGERRIDLYVRDLNVSTPYNTYLISGLPIGPICSPDENTIKATINFKNSDYKFFFSKKDGSQVYSKTYEEHLAATEKYKWY